MTRVGTTAVRELAKKLQSEAGLKFALARLQESEGSAPGSVPVAHVLQSFASAELLEKRAGAAYPAVHVYCEKIENRLVEKFRTFSGTLHMVADVRVSDGNVNNVDSQLRLQVEAILHVLDLSRGAWAGGAFYGGGYSVDFEGVRHGGSHYVQSAKIRFELKASVN